MARARQDYELARDKQPNARMKGKSAKEGFYKNVEANNAAYDPDGSIMHKWTSAIYWGTDDHSGEAFDFDLLQNLIRSMVHNETTNPLSGFNLAIKQF